MYEQRKISVSEALEKLRATGNTFTSLFWHGTLEVEIYKPKKVDPQQPHDRDELYLIIAGKGDFFCGGEQFAFTAGDFLFVPAKVEHRFIDFNDDFATWVIFFGRKGGETLA